MLEHRTRTLRNHPTTNDKNRETLGEMLQTIPKLDRIVSPKKNPPFQIWCSGGFPQIDGVYEMQSGVYEDRPWWKKDNGWVIRWRSDGGVWIVDKKLRKQKKGYALSSSNTDARTPNDDAGWKVWRNKKWRTGVFCVSDKPPKKIHKEPHNIRKRKESVDDSAAQKRVSKTPLPSKSKASPPAYDASERRRRPSVNDEDVGTPTTTNADGGGSACSSPLTDQSSRRSDTLQVPGATPPDTPTRTYSDIAMSILGDMKKTLTVDKDEECRKHMEV